MAYSDNIGDSQPTAVSTIVAALSMSNTTLAKISDIDDPINNTTVSGKKLGSMVVVASAAAADIFIAGGSLTDSLWMSMKTGAGADVTPA